MFIQSVTIGHSEKKVRVLKMGDLLATIVQMLQHKLHETYGS